jgi:type II secretory pathway component GspD/PulD (secretin)
MTYYAGGGGAGADQTNASQPIAYGGIGGGGNGQQYNNISVQAGTANTGGGGGGAVTSGVASGAGGSGIVIISVLTSQYTGTVTGSPTVTTNGNQTVIKWTSSGTYTA